MVRETVVYQIELIGEHAGEIAHVGLKKGAVIQPAGACCAPGRRSQKERRVAPYATGLSVKTPLCDLFAVHDKLVLAE